MNTPAPSPVSRSLYWGGIAAAAFVFVWIATSPAALVHINWETGGYLFEIASGQSAWARSPWNAHFLLGFIYDLFTRLAAVAGGTPADGLRILDALSVSITAVAMTGMALHLTRDRILAAGAAAVWATAYVTMFLVFTLEDNLVFLAPASLVLWICVARADAWTWWWAATAGALVGLTALISAQGILYIFPPLYTLLVTRSTTLTPWKRILFAVVTVIAFGAAMLLLPALASLGSTLTLKNLWTIEFTKPQPSEIPSSWPELVNVFTDVRGGVFHVGVGARLQVFAHRWPPPAETYLLMGTLFLTGAALTFAGTAGKFWQRRPGVVHMLAATLLAYLVATGMYRDVPFAYLKRMDFVPIFVAILLAVAAGKLRPSSRPRTIAAAALWGLVVLQLVVGLNWRSTEARTFATMAPEVGVPPVGYLGPGGRSWFGFFRSIREERPGACLYVFSFSEPWIKSGRKNPDVFGSMLSELPTARILGAPTLFRGWRWPPRTIDRKELDPAVARGCVWLSDKAKGELGPAAK